MALGEVGAMRGQRRRNMARLLTLGYEMDGDEYILRGWWELLRPNFGSFMGYTILLLMMVFVVNYVFKSITLLGLALVFFLVPLWVTGFFVFAYKLLLGEPVQFGDFLQGFTKSGASLVAWLLSWVVITIGVILFLLVYEVSGNFFTEVSTFGFIVLAFLAILCVLPGMYLHMAYAFVPLLVIDQSFEVWPAIEMSRQLVNRRFFAMFKLIGLLYLANIGGMICYGMGLLFTLPLTACALTVAYMDIMNQAERGSAFE